MPIVNTAMAGAFAASTDLLKLESIVAAIPDVVPVEVKANQQAATEAFDAVRIRSSALGVTWP